MAPVTLEGLQAKDGQPCPQGPSSPPTSHRLCPLLLTGYNAGLWVRLLTLGPAPVFPSSMKPSLTTPKSQTRNGLIFPGAHDTSPVPFL